MLCSFLALPVSVAAEAEASALAKIDPALLEKMETASPDEKIPVAIWYTDIDQDNVDKLTVNKVGYTQDDIALTYEMPSTELISDLEKGEDGAADEMQAYLKRTEAKRERERKRTNEYVMTRREFSREKYNEKSTIVVKDMSIEEKDIIFTSQYAPMIFAELTVLQINSIKLNSYIENIYFNEEKEEIPESIETALDAAKVNEVNSNSSLGLSGEGVKVGIIENHSVLISEEEQTSKYIVPDTNPPKTRYTSSGVIMTDYGNVVVVGNTSYSVADSHPNKVADSLLSVSPNIILYSCNNSPYNIEGMITDGVQIMSRSIGLPVAEDSSEYAYTAQEIWYDHIVSKHSIAILKSAGNDGEKTEDIYDDGRFEDGPRVSSPGLAYNLITVGAYCDTTEGIYSPNTLYKSSSYKNSTDIYSGCEKPDVIAPASFNDGGTSNATPFLAGMVALMYELKPSLATYPQAVKAIVLASSHTKVTQLDGYGETEDIKDGITERQGAGAPDAWTMMCIVSQGTYGVGRISAARDQAVRRFVMPSYDSSSMNVTLTWIKENTIKSGTSHAVEDNAVEGADVNLDLSVYRNDGKNWHSKLSNSSTEMVYFDLNNSYKNYEIRISDVGAYEGVIRYGYAYSTNDPYITPATDEGIYYIRNYVSVNTLL